MRTSSMPPPMPWCSLVRAAKLDEAEAAARDLLVRFPDVHDGWDRLGMVHEARGDSRQAADCYRKVIDFIRQRPDDYDAGMIEQFAKLVDRLDPPRGDLNAPPSLALGEGVGHATICDRDQIARPTPSDTVIGLTSSASNIMAIRNTGRRSCRSTRQLLARTQTRTATRRKLPSRFWCSTSWAGPASGMAARGHNTWRVGALPPIRKIEPPSPGCADGRVPAPARAGRLNGFAMSASLTARGWGA